MKIKLILLIYDTLLCGGEIVREQFCTEHSISERTFYRYLNDICTFLRMYKDFCLVDVIEPEGRYFMRRD